jgi:hypothetical protein
VTRKSTPLSSVQVISAFVCLFLCAYGYGSPYVFKVGIAFFNVLLVVFFFLLFLLPVLYVLTKRIGLHTLPIGNLVVVNIVGAPAILLFSVLLIFIIKGVLGIVTIGLDGENRSGCYVLTEIARSKIFVIDLTDAGSGEKQTTLRIGHNSIKLIGNIPW